MEKPVTNRTVDWLNNNGYTVHDKDLRLFCYPKYRPEFHLAFRVFISGLPGFPRTGKSHSFVVKLDNTELEDYLKDGMSTVQIPEGRNNQERRTKALNPHPQDSPAKKQREKREKKKRSLEASHRGLDSGVLPSY